MRGSDYEPATTTRQICEARPGEPEEEGTGPSEQRGVNGQSFKTKNPTAHWQSGGNSLVG
jgi:hypothetical protein